MLGFTVDGAPPTLNVMLREHFGARKKRTKEWIEAILYFVPNPGHWAKYSDIKATVEMCRGFCGRSPDWDNVAASIKCPLDALVRLGILKDDSPKYIKEVKVTQKRYPHRTEVKTSFTITWIEDETPTGLFD